jgi:hypothetical protein
VRAYIAALCDESAWQAWQPLEGSWLGAALPACGGLYRIRLVHEIGQQLAYIGQSGNLKERVYALRHVYGALMPYKVPHAAGPALWSWRQKCPSSRYEVSIATYPAVPPVLRLGLECLALALSRQQHQSSPLCQFGRMPLGYAPPTSGNDARLVLCEKRYRGGTTLQFLDCHRPGLAPQGPLVGGPHARLWCGLSWTPWISHGRLQPVGEAGLYRLRVPGLDALVFLGQGKLAERLKPVALVQGMECSWVAQNAWTHQQRLELLTDLIGAHLLSTDALPLWQFEPGRDGPGGQSRQRVS